VDVRIQHSTYFGAFLTVTAWAGLPADSAAQPAGPGVLVILQNDAGVPPDIAAIAQAEVVRLYGLIGVDIAWVTKVPDPVRRVRVVSLVKWEPADDAVPASVLGLTPLDHEGRGYRGYVFWRRVERASQKFAASLNNVLAIAIAHELGHTLLPNGSHATRGLMEAHWNSAHFRSASAGLLHFSSETAALIRRELLGEVTVAQRAR
jgi:hypothetical protein